MATFITALDIGSGTRLAIKDLIDVAGVPTTAGCRAVADLARPAERDAACLTEIRRQVDAGELRIVGKTNLHELAYGTTGVNPWFGTPRNPLDPSLIPGGSSSGSAVAVAAGEADVALGTDTGGSVRIPAACCGVAGLKTTWGRISIEGVWPLAPSLDTVGPMARDVAGLVLGMQLLEPGFRPAGDVDAVGRLRLPADPAIDAAVDAALRAAGMAVHDVADPGWKAAWAAGGGVLGAEAWRLDGHLLTEHRDGVGAVVAERLEASRAITAEQEQACRDHQPVWRQTLLDLLGRTPLLALPTLSAFPPPIDDVDGFPGNRSNLPVNFAGLPALALPVPAGGPLPASLQLIGPPGGEELLLAVGARIEAAVSRP